MERVITSISIRTDIKERAEKAINEGNFAGISNFSALVEYALDYILKIKEAASS